MSIEIRPASEGPQQPPPPPPLRYSLADMLILMAAVGVVLGLVQRFGKLPTGLVEMYYTPLQFQIAATVIAALYALPVASVLWTAIFGWRKGAAFPREPGHWLLILTGLAFLERVATLELLIQAGPRYSLPWPLAAYVWMLPWLAGCVASFVAYRRTQSPSWQDAFFLFGACRALVMGGAFLGNLINFDESMVAPFLAFGGILGWLFLKGLLVFAESKHYQLTKSPGILHRFGVALYGLEDIVLFFVILQFERPG